MSSHLILFGWNRSIPGREKVSAAHFDDFVKYLGGLQQAATIQAFEVVFLDVHGGDLNGLFLIKGDAPARLADGDERLDHPHDARIAASRRGGCRPRVTGDDHEANGDLEGRDPSNGCATRSDCSTLLWRTHGHPLEDRFAGVVGIASHGRGGNCRDAGARAKRVCEDRDAGGLSALAGRVEELGALGSERPEGDREPHHARKGSGRVRLVRSGVVVRCRTPSRRSWPPTLPEAAVFHRRTNGITETNTTDNYR